MKNQNLTAKLPSGFTAEDRAQIEAALELAESAYVEQTRADGTPCMVHCIAVAEILLGLDASPSMVVAGLLHDITLDTSVTLEEIQSKFGSTVAGLVAGCAKITSLQQLSRGDQLPNERLPLPVPLQNESDTRKNEMVVETMRKMLLAIGDDIRVILIKLADRLHNMRTLAAMPEDRQTQIAQDTLDIFSPLANRLGIWQIKWELEDLGFFYTNRQKYQEISDQIALKLEKRTEEINEIMDTLQKQLREAGVTAKISGRPKHIYSIYRKMMRKGQNFEAIRDLRAVRVLVETVETCYKVLGLVHMSYQPIPGEFDDYIAAKKPNNYQSLHTAVIYTDGKPLEIQIRTPEMHQNAEYGIAAHWRYKENSSLISNQYEQKVTSLRSLLALSKENDDNQDVLDAISSDVFRDEVYALSPKGRVFTLPAGSTPIDFAYQVHTDIGHRCRGAKVNGKLVTLDYVLSTGDQVEILTVKKGGPSRDWLNPSLGLVKSSRSKSKIRQWFKQQDHDENLLNGKEQIEREFKRLGVNQPDLERYAAHFSFKSLDDLYIAVGCGDFGIGRLVNLFADEQKESLEAELQVKPSSFNKQTVDSGFTVTGMKGLATSAARCCHPAPGDEIIGYITRGRGVTIHRADCPNVTRVKEKERLLKVDWGQSQQTFPVEIQLIAINHFGLMSEISAVLSSEPVRLVDLNMVNRNQLVRANLVVELAGLDQLSRLLARLDNIPNVMEASRVKPG
ncbi:MAG: bifunctional (p)ppGpp synthetase/guanosine-3',5'-bis(diphosphate) 3'-pyrophosphohydrolase [Anaerolineaceae bacterium]|nr:bifunctional (p)ppGpp synthetase/guanosine-3',5'-bis(diphosphate) 3'-pyrophosphohydrolase [Anaerolineaceae bacterium]